LHLDESTPTSVRDIAERTALPQPYLEQILLALKGAGLVRSKRGVGGGYVLARPAGEITLGQIVSAVDGPIAVGDFGPPHENGACDHEGQCALLGVWAEVGQLMREHLDSFTLADMVRRARGNADDPFAAALPPSDAPALPGRPAAAASSDALAARAAAPMLSSSN
jgi:Rrf2 family iron-sulfur cluster assembly transcriptional regulator